MERGSTGKHIWLFSKPYFGWILTGVLATMGSTACDLFIADILRQIIDFALAGNSTAIGKPLLMGGFLLIGGMVSNYLMVYCTGTYSINILKDIRRTTVEHLQKLPLVFTTKNKTGELLAKLSGDAEVVQNFLEGAFIDTLYVPVMLLGFASYMLQLDWRLFLACFWMLPILLPLSVMTMKPVKACSREYTKYLGKTNNNVQDVVDGIGIVKAYNLEEEMAGKYQAALQKALDMSLKNDKRQYAVEPISYLIMHLPVVICLIYGGYLAIKGTVSLGTLAAFLTLLKLVINPLIRGYQLIINSKSAMASAERLFSTLDEEIEQSGRMGQAEINPANSLVFSLENVSYAYNGENTVLQNFNLSIPQGKKIAIVGSSGSGKSTILKLLCRYHEIDRGTIRFFGTEYTALDLNYLRSNITYVSQESFLFPVSIGENIAVGKTGASVEEVMEAAKMANAHDFIMKLPRGYATEVGERGSMLSGGQIQRIAIARAILKNTPVLLLDEATSALDAANEELVKKALDNLCRGKTLVVVAHRLSTIENADEIIVLEKGAIVERGDHHRLIADNGVYTRLYRTGEHEVPKRRKSCNVN
ncbi:MAG TPA: ABC transporter ATP-binding protein [Bacillota bacterium]|nr:ABC transporter ATP-binding protein [Bacillota bacterium]